MKYQAAVLTAFAVTNVFGHGVITEVQGANGVNLPGLSTIDGTPRDCPTPGCGSEADTSIIRQRELGTQRASALGRSPKGGPVDATKMMTMFMDGAGGNTTAVKNAREVHAANRARYVKLATPKGTSETGVKAATGAAMGAGLPTTSDDGTIMMTFHQVNQDGAGPLKAAVDATSGGQDAGAFKDATVKTNVPGLGIGGLSAAQTMDFPVAVQMPEGMTCQGSVGGASNVCIVRLQNAAVAGPFGGSAAFTQSTAAKKRAIEFNLRKRRFARGLEAEEAEQQ
ncbi:hypothetical protein PG994_010934 [Apiospora phragmitis]|uniref:MAS3 protein n=1 Tax=Apiospora phragmitis TaxID=2905665 RepID=A0ABR1TU08_9PEZI